MYEVRENEVKVNGIPVNTFFRLVEEENAVILAEADTTGYRGGDKREQGDRTYVSFFC